MDKEFIEIHYLVTGKIGMSEAIWRKFENAPFPAIIKEAHRNMSGYEAAILTIEAKDGIKGHKLLRGTIGDKLMNQYDIQTT